MTGEEIATLMRTAATFMGGFLLGHGWEQVTGIILVLLVLTPPTTTT